MSRTTPIVHKTRTQVVVEVLREKILSGEIAAGEPLRQSALAEEMNVSRIPVREALLQLEAEGLVKFEAHKGATATELSVEQVSELFELRALIETDLLAKAIPNLQDEDLRQAEAVLDKLESAFKQDNAVGSWSELNTEFHTSLYRAANRPHTMEVVHGLNTNCDRYIRLQLLLTGGIPRAEQDHRDLLQLCRQKKIDEAVVLLRAHILHAANAIRELVAQQVS
ncbi:MULTISPECIES: GntR family transcriptional regulator [Shewanella]|jgi:DNA-binding GntR family transcriptional regulator|uniref:GntR family transcriptional regulator n=3 Tax=Bacteria TaxID=2 RepID=A0A2T3H3X2_9GAMM|nr:MULTISPECIES: GntR family transcriptional regulator [Shewanella]AXQ16184.1 GntR family transcriptional regulator [Shewanella algae]AYV14148.1 GntR family transcriptional regulator [Shewanella algae]EKT4488542.1 GntR family transcriptional regulator [Shewanella algae]MBC8797771.1 GntR family transcriptional regulator [Shewanella algae]MBO2548273.1 GntR family transcriptional regulator [Shewanella algae]